MDKPEVPSYDKLFGDEEELKRKMAAVFNAAEISSEQVLRELAVVRKVVGTLNISMSALAKIIGVSGTSVKDWLGERAVPRPSTWAKVRVALAEVLNANGTAET